MNRQHPAISLVLSLSAAALAQSTAATPRLNPPKPQLAPNYGKLSLSFEANQGQTDSQVKFLSRGDGYALFLTNKSAVLALTKSGCPILAGRASIGRP